MYGEQREVVVGHVVHVMDDEGYEIVVCASDTRQVSYDSAGYWLAVASEEELLAFSDVDEIALFWVCMKRTTAVNYERYHGGWLWREHFCHGRALGGSADQAEGAAVRWHSFEACDISEIRVAQAGPVAFDANYNVASGARDEDGVALGTSAARWRGTSRREAENVVTGRRQRLDLYTVW